MKFVFEWTPPWVPNAEPPMRKLHLERPSSHQGLLRPWSQEGVRSPGTGETRGGPWDPRVSLCLFMHTLVLEPSIKSGSEKPFRRRNAQCPHWSHRVLSLGSARTPLTYCVTVSTSVTFCDFSHRHPFLAGGRAAVSETRAAVRLAHARGRAADFMSWCRSSCMFSREPPSLLPEKAGGLSPRPSRTAITVMLLKYVQSRKGTGCLSSAWLGCGSTSE